MSEAFYSHAKLYDLMFPGGGPAADFYRAEADRPGGRVLELGCGTGHKLIPIASDGHPCVGLDFSSDMLAEARRKADERGVAVEWVHGDMRDFDLGRTFDFVFIAANSLLHLHDARGPGELLPVGPATPGTWRALCLRCLQPERAPPGRSRRRPAHAGVVVVHRSRPWRRERRCR